MATAETVDMGPPHAPKEESINAFKEIEIDLKKLLQHMRHEHDKHESEYFSAVSQLSDHELTTFTPSNLTQVRVAGSAYGMHLFGKVKLEALDDGYIHFRAFVPNPGNSEVVKLHCIHTEETEDGEGGKTYKAVFGKEQELEWFDT
ncbi:hypothetical protein BJ878DRAFT_418797 [Calycina marina]|uniref:Uncharacterized protein n=1 Tax=Calycina marina TaxID=1763456 RepID=A0A9P7Z590_9HELO|nr:hypothetical protein BJ878DRAFT_418797 [Calycina marina]